VKLSRPDSHKPASTKAGAIQSVKDRDLTTPPASPANGDRYIVPAAATGVWAGKTNQIAVRIADAWEYNVPKIGWLCFIEDEAKLSAYKSTGWSAGLAI
ncbi:DUF2793 domain-containing protein, partial [Massilia varians]|uniref:DUF2793 domain-containing protein n=2 Tax=Massilia varians TaxID=457921 RepID=UPI003612C665